MHPPSVAATQRAFLEMLNCPGMTAEDVAEWGARMARACLDSAEAVETAAPLLCGLALHSEPQLARAGVEGIFRHAAENMSDAFEPRLCDRYLQFFARVLWCCRAFPHAEWVDERLRRFGLRTEQDLTRRARRLGRKPKRMPAEVRKIVVLSRVTLGADVAVTSVMLEKMMRVFPGAELVLLASPRAALLFAGQSRLATRPVEYPRDGGLLERLGAWPLLVDRIEEELRGLKAGEYLVVDPDSRLTQLGMLPAVADESSYIFFESRAYSQSKLQTLAEITAAWATERFGPDTTPLRPWVAFAPEAIARAQAIRSACGGERLVSVNLGVGDNPAKRIEDPFEERLLAALLDSGWRVFLDRGEGEEESSRIERLLSSLRKKGWKLAELEESCGLPDHTSQLVSWRGSLAGFGALIGQSSLYIGYDSAGAHIAAALGVKTIDIFAGFQWPRMPQRWKPSGAGAVHLIVVDPHSPRDPEKILAQVWEAARW